MPTSTPASIPELDGLAGLAANADAIGAEAPPAGQPGAPGTEVLDAAPSQVDQLAAMLHMIGQAGAMRFPSLAKTYSEEKCRATAQCIAPALERMGWNIDAGESMIYLTAAGATLMLLVETRNVILSDLKVEQSAEAAKKAAPPAAEGIAQQAAAAVSESPEVAVHDQMKLYAKSH